jgi:hypothetical protein
MKSEKSKMEYYRKLMRAEKIEASDARRPFSASAFSALRISQMIKTFFRQPLF